MQKISANLRFMLAVATAAYIAYYFLLNDNFLHSSISSIIAHARPLAVKKHLIVLGLLPIYIATIIFGSATIVIYLTARLEHLLASRDKTQI